MRQLFIITTLILNCFIFNAFSQKGLPNLVEKPISKEEKVTAFMKKATEAGISEAKANFIVFLYEAFQKKMKIVSEKSRAIASASLIYMNDGNTARNFIRRSFFDEMLSFLSPKEFKILFYEQFEFKIEEEQRKEFLKYTKDKGLSIEQKKNIRKATDDYAEKKVVILEYYSIWKDRSRELEIINNELKVALDKINPTITSEGMLNNNEKNLESFIARAQMAGVSLDNLEALKRAYYEREKNIKIAEETVRANYLNEIVYFHDDEKSKKKALDIFKRQMAGLITLEQFKAIFKDHLKERVNREAFRAYDNIVMGLEKEITQSQKNELLELIKEQKLSETVARQYYGYDHKLSIQKLKTQQYKFKAILKDKIAAFN